MNISRYNKSVLRYLLYVGVLRLRATVADHHQQQLIIWLHYLVEVSFDLFRYLSLGDQLKPWKLHPLVSYRIRGQEYVLKNGEPVLDIEFSKFEHSGFVSGA